MDKQLLYNRFLEQHPVDSEFIQQFLDGTLDSHESMISFDGDAEEAYEHLVDEFFDYFLKRVTTDKNCIILYRGLLNVEVNSLSKSLGRHWSIHEDVSKDLYSNGALLTAHFLYTAIDYFEGFQNFIGGGKSRYELNPLPGVIPVALKFNEMTLDHLAYNC